MLPPRQRFLMLKLLLCFSAAYASTSSSMVRFDALGPKSFVVDVAANTKLLDFYSNINYQNNQLQTFYSTKLSVSSPGANAVKCTKTGSNYNAGQTQFAQFINPTPGKWNFTLTYDDSNECAGQCVPEQLDFNVAAPQCYLFNCTSNLARDIAVATSTDTTSSVAAIPAKAADFSATLFANVPSYFVFRPFEWAGNKYGDFIVKCQELDANGNPIATVGGLNGMGKLQMNMRRNYLPTPLAQGDLGDSSSSLLPWYQDEARYKFDGRFTKSDTSSSDNAADWGFDAPCPRAWPGATTTPDFPWKNAWTDQWKAATGRRHRRLLVAPAPTPLKTPPSWQSYGLRIDSASNTSIKCTVSFDEQCPRGELCSGQLIGGIVSGVLVAVLFVWIFYFVPRKYKFRISGPDAAVATLKSRQSCAKWVLYVSAPGVVVLAVNPIYFSMGLVYAAFFTVAWVAVMTYNKGLTSTWLFGSVLGIPGTFVMAFAWLIVAIGTYVRTAPWVYVTAYLSLYYNGLMLVAQIASSLYLRQALPGSGGGDTSQPLMDCLDCCACVARAKEIVIVREGAANPLKPTQTI